MIMKYAADNGGRIIHDAELNDKFSSYKINERFFKRRAMIFDSTTSQDQFVEFIMDVKHIISNPNKAALGAGVELFSITDKPMAEKFFLSFEKYG